MFSPFLFIFLAVTGVAQPEANQLEGAMDDRDIMRSGLADPAAAYVPVPVPSEKALAYYHSGNFLWFVDLAFGWLVSLAMLLTGFSAHLRNIARRIGKRWFFTVAIYFALFSCTMFLASLPLQFYAGYWREHAYGLSDQTMGRWLGNQAKALALTIFIGGLIIWIPYLLLRLSPKRWWFYSGLVAVPFLVFAMLISPVWITPIFNDVTRLPDGPLKNNIEALASRAGIEGSDIFVINMSADTKAINAYVAGLGNTNRIVLWDTLLERMNEPEILSVVSHEMGHYVLGHAWIGLFLAATILFLTFYAVHLGAGWMISIFQERLGFTELGDIASLPLLVLLMSVASFVFNPFALAVARQYEHEADQFGLEMSQNNHAAASALAKFQTDNLRVPRPGLLYQIWRGSHPALGDRIDFCNRYRPWEANKPLVYGRYFTPAPSSSP